MEQALPVPPRIWVHPELSGVLFCSICSLLCSVLKIFVCLFVFCLLTIACHSNYGFWLPFRFLQTFRITASDYLLGFFRLFELRLLITFWVFSDFSNYGFWLPFGFLQTFRITASDYLLGFFRLFELRLLITFWVSSDFSNFFSTNFNLTCYCLGDLEFLFYLSKLRLQWNFGPHHLFQNTEWTC